MELKEVLDKATERPWEILRTGSLDEQSWGTYTIGVSSAHNKSIENADPGDPRIVARPIATVQGKANAELIVHAVNALKPLLEAAKDAAGFMVSETGDYGRSNDSIAETFGGNDRLMALTEAIRLAGEVAL